jgi:hypothetical protein
MDLSSCRHKATPLQALSPYSAQKTFPKCIWGQGHKFLSWSHYWSPILMCPIYQSQILLSHNLLGEEWKPMPLPHSLGPVHPNILEPLSQKLCSRWKGVWWILDLWCVSLLELHSFILEKRIWIQDNPTPPHFRHSSVTWLLLFFAKKFSSNYMHIYFFPLCVFPPSNSHTHPPKQFSLLAWSPSRCHLKVRKSSKVGASLLYLQEYLLFWWALLSWKASHTLYPA